MTHTTKCAGCSQPATHKISRNLVDFLNTGRPYYYACDYHTSISKQWNEMYKDNFEKIEKIKKLDCL